jgi:hypothetical protein
MRNINRRESPRIEIQLRCHVTSPALWLRSDFVYRKHQSQRRPGSLARRRRDAADAFAGTDSDARVGTAGEPRFWAEVHSLPGDGVAGFTDSGHGYPQVALRVNYMDFRAFHDRLHATEDVQSPAWMAEFNGHGRFQIRDQAAAEPGGRGVLDAAGVSVRAYERVLHVAGRWRHGLAHSHRPMDSCQPRGAVPRHVLLFEAGWRLVCVGVVIGRDPCDLQGIGGLAAVALFAALLLATIFTLVFLVARRKSNAVLAIAVTVLAIASSSIHWLARPHLFTICSRSSS